MESLKTEDFEVSYWNWKVVYMYKGVSKLSGLWLGSQYSEMIAKSANQLYCGNSGRGTKNYSRSGSGYKTNLTLHAI